MNIKLYEDRTIEKEGEAGTKNENNVTDIEIIVPKKYENYNKKIVFETNDGIVWDFIEDNHYKIRKNISKYQKVDFYIWLTKGNEDFRSETDYLIFNRNQDASEALTEEDTDGLNKVFKILEDDIKKVSDLEKDYKNLIDDIKYKLENGEFKGEKGDTPQKGIDYFTSEEKEEFKEAVVEESKEEIKSTVIADTKKELNSHIEDKKTELDNYTTSKETSLKNELDEHTNKNKTELDTNKTSLETEMSNTKDSLVQEFNTNATAKTNAFNENYTEKLNEFNENTESYKERIETIQNTLPKAEKTLENNTITINNAPNYQLQNLAIRSKNILSQNSIPSLSNPIDIDNVISGEIQIKINNQTNIVNLGTNEIVKLKDEEGWSDYLSYDSKTKTLYLNKNIRKLVLDGTKGNWGKENNNTNSFFRIALYTNSSDIPYSGNDERYDTYNSNNLICNYLPKFNDNFQTNFALLVYNGTIWFQFLYDNELTADNTVEENFEIIKSKLAEKPLEIYYRKKETEKINLGTYDLNLLDGENTITITTNNANTSKISYVTKASSYDIVKNLDERVTILEEDRVNYISKFEVEGESVQAEEPDFLTNKEVPLQIIKDSININLSNGINTKSFVFPLQKPLVGNFNFTDYEKDILDLLNEKEVHHWNYMNVVASEQNWLTRSIPARNAYSLYLALSHINNNSKAVSNLFSKTGTVNYEFWIQARGEFTVNTKPSEFGTLDSMTQSEAIAKWKEMLAGKNLEVAYYMYDGANHYVENLKFTEQQKNIARQIKNLIMYEGYTNVSVNHTLNPSATLIYSKSNKQAIENIDKKLDEIINLLSTSSTSALLLDNLENDLEKEVL